MTKIIVEYKLDNGKIPSYIDDWWYYPDETWRMFWVSDDSYELPEWVVVIDKQTFKDKFTNKDIYEMKMVKKSSEDKDLELDNFLLKKINNLQLKKNNDKLRNLNMIKL